MFLTQLTVLLAPGWGCEALGYWDMVIEVWYKMQTWIYIILKMILWASSHTQDDTVQWNLWYVMSSCNMWEITLCTKGIWISLSWNVYLNYKNVNCVFYMICSVEIPCMFRVCMFSICLNWLKFSVDLIVKLALCIGIISLVYLCYVDYSMMGGCMLG